MELRQSVQIHLDTIEAMAGQAKARIMNGVVSARPVTAPALDPMPTPKRYNVSFEEDLQPAVSFNDVFQGQVDGEGIPVWEEAP